jgi:nucleoid-associated protein YgaU
MELLLGTLMTDQPSVAFVDLLTGAASAVLVAAAGWLAAVVAAVLVEALSDGRLRPARFTGAPAWLRRALLGVVVGVLSLIGLGPAAIADGGQGAPPTLEGLALPDRTPGGVRVVPATRAPSRVSVTVGAGDSLWSIAEDLLPNATDAELLEAVHVLHRHNRDQLDDPDLLHPGQCLRVPPVLAHHHRQEQP